MIGLECFMHAGLILFFWIGLECFMHVGLGLSLHKGTQGQLKTKTRLHAARLLQKWYIPNIYQVVCYNPHT